jgi:large subunit ribosomal protein L22
MEVTAKLRYLRIAPRKVRLVADLIRGKTVGKAKSILKFTTKRAALPLLKLLDSAISNAKNNFRLSSDNLYIKKITVDEGPKYKRWMPRARGQAYEIQKKTSHITIVLDESERIVDKGKADFNNINKKDSVDKNKDNKKENIIKSDIKDEEELKTVIEKEKIKPKIEKEMPKPKTEAGIRRIFRRKAI